MIKTALLGHPTGHSLSKIIHETAFAQTKIDGNYEVFDVLPDDLKNTVESLTQQGFTGFNVTIPHKTAVTEFLNDVDDNVRAAGCTNTVKINADGSLSGFNTDIFGFQKGLEKDFENALIIGNGGAAKAAATALADKKTPHLTLLVRNFERGNVLKDQVTNNFPCVKITVTTQITDLSGFDLIVNSTPLGMYGKFVDETPVDEKLFATAETNAVAYDIVYNPAKTLFLKNAEKHGLQTVEGLDMLVWQALKAFEIWTGVTPDFSAMKKAAQIALQNF